MTWSASPAKVPFDEKWLGCMSHRLNTVMKHVVDSEIRTKTTIATDLALVKSIVRIAKQSGWNRYLPEGLALYAEGETRFGTTHDMITSFLKSHAEVEKLIETHGSAQVNQSFQSLTRRPSVAGFEGFPALAAIIHVFGLIRTMQKVAETNNKPTLYMMLPMLKNIKRQFRTLSSGFVPSSNVAVQSDETIRLAESTLIEVKKIPLHYLYVAACVLHPGMRCLQRLIGDETERSTLLSKATVLIKRVMSTCSVSAQPKDTGSSVPAPTSTVRNDGSFVLNEFVMFNVGNSIAGNDEFARYLVFDLTDKMQDHLKHDMGVLQFWVDQSRSFPTLSAAALRIMSIPPWFIASERDLSFVNRIVTPQRNRTNSDVLEDMVFVRSFDSSSE